MTTKIIKQIIFKHVDELGDKLTAPVEIMVHRIIADIIEESTLQEKKVVQGNPTRYRPEANLVPFRCQSCGNNEMCNPRSVKMRKFCTECSKKRRVQQTIDWQNKQKVAREQQKEEVLNTMEQDLLNT